jgi:hypothetical protein
MRQNKTVAVMLAVIASFSIESENQYEARAPFV